MDDVPAMNSDLGRHGIGLRLCNSYVAERCVFYGFAEEICPVNYCKNVFFRPSRLLNPVLDSEEKTIWKRQVSADATAGAETP
ncbi:MULTISPECIES: hypothetical protein [unclassified Roseovarius]|uniref:hypothetical protein n=1 Tax=unclassified Roseovarius TaxID=2614913 RepID=UPI00273F3281|nr:MULTISPECIES: hypothetical protein [unclassified Roseovarius]